MTSGGWRPRRPADVMKVQVTARHFQRRLRDAHLPANGLLICLGLARRNVEVISTSLHAASPVTRRAVEPRLGHLRADERRKDEAAHLLEAFYTTKPGGLGMGLVISRSIVDGDGVTLRRARVAPEWTTARWRARSHSGLAHEAGTGTHASGQLVTFG
jgi:hypothetical protein